MFLDDSSASEGIFYVAVQILKPFPVNHIGIDFQEKVLSEIEMLERHVVILAHRFDFKRQA